LAWRTSIYLEEFTRKSWITDVIGVNIANLAATCHPAFMASLAWRFFISTELTNLTIGGRACADTDDLADDHHFHPRIAEINPAFAMQR
jgi:hypothetical protein